MRALSTYLSHLFILFILLSLFPIIYYSLIEPVNIEALLFRSSYEFYRDISSIKIGYQIESNIIYLYNYGDIPLVIYSVSIDGKDVYYVQYVYLEDLGWIESDTIPPDGFSVIILDSMVSGTVYLTINNVSIGVLVG
jgi:hypothetical protein